MWRVLAHFVFEFDILFSCYFSLVPLRIIFHLLKVIFYFNKCFCNYTIRMKLWGIYWNHCVCLGVCASRFCPGNIYIWNMHGRHAVAKSLTLLITKCQNGYDCSTDWAFPFIPFLLTLTLFQGHSGIKQPKVKFVSLSKLLSNQV